MSDSDPKDVKKGAQSDEMLNQRSENSVLFSLNNLTAVGDKGPNQSQAGYASSGGGAATGGAGKDKSGLIDLSTLAQLGAGQALGDAQGEEGAQVPVLFNTGSKKSNRGLILGIVFLILVVLGLGGFVGYLMVFKEEEKKQTAEEETEEPKEDENAIAKAEQDKLAHQKKLDEEAAAARLAEKEEKGEEKSGEPAVEGEETGEEGEETATAKEDGKKRSSKKDEEKSSSKKDDKKSKVDEAVANLDKNEKKKVPLSKKAVGKVLKASEIRVRKCGKDGDLKVSFQIKPSGSVSGVKAVGGSFKGSATERCVLGIVKKLSFPEFDGDPFPVKYPYKL